jgi:hypothetical protein
MTTANPLYADHKYTLPRIKHIMELTATPGLPTLVAPEAVGNVVKDTLTSWEGLVLEFYAKVNRLLGGVFDECFKQFFARYEKSPINQKVHEILRQFFGAATARLHESLTRLCRLETTQIMTANRVDYQNALQANVAILTLRQRRNLEEQREAARAEREEQQQEAASENRGRKRPRTTLPSPGPDDGELVDPFSNEVHVLAQVCSSFRLPARPVLDTRSDLDRSHLVSVNVADTAAQVQAYHDIARKRFVDYVNLCIHGELVEDCQSKLLEELRRELCMDSPGGKPSPVYLFVAAIG